PRLGLGYSLAAQLGLLKKLGLVKTTDNQLKNYVANLNRLQAKFGITSKTSNNPAKKLALQLANKIPILVASEFLAGNAHVLANQINESAKNFSNYFLISELNHHLLEGLTFPKTNPQNLFFVFFESKLYHPKNQLRYKITEKIVAKNRIKFFTYKLAAADKVGQAMEMLLFGSYASFYLAVLNKVDPGKIPWVDYLKSELKKSR
ncbi:MAG: hypothetical protein NTX98_02060, partial [Candidatus Doudnabacteria bacterium]|nr:hypothetical protein [Candidatus Doudnabacteria bacterium]